MASNRGRISTRAKKHSFLSQLDDIASLLDQGQIGCKEVIRQLSSIIDRIYRDSFQTPEGNHRRLSARMCAAIEKTLMLLIDKFGRDLEERKRGNPSVYLLEARYCARRCHVEQALGLYREIEKYYPAYKESYFAHGNLLRSCKRDAEAAEVINRYQINIGRYQLAKQVRAPGTGRLRSLSYLGVSFFSKEPDEKNILSSSESFSVLDIETTFRLAVGE